MSEFKVDLLSQELSYRCGCGRTIRVPFESVAADSKDYCGCGRRSITLGSPEDVAIYRQIAGVDKLGQ